MERARLHSGRLCDQPAAAPSFRDPGLEGGGGPGARGPFRGALRLPALQRDAIVGHRTLLSLRTPRSTAPLIEQGGINLYSYRN